MRAALAGLVLVICVAEVFAQAGPEPRERGTPVVGPRRQSIHEASVLTREIGESQNNAEYKEKGAKIEDKNGGDPNEAANADSESDFSTSGEFPAPDQAYTQPDRETLQQWTWIGNDDSNEIQFPNFALLPNGAYLPISVFPDPPRVAQLVMLASACCHEYDHAVQDSVTQVTGPVVDPECKSKEQHIAMYEKQIKFLDDAKLHLASKQQLSSDVENAIDAFRKSMKQHLDAIKADLAALQEANLCG